MQTYVGVYAPNRNGKHAVKIRVGPPRERDEITKGEEAREEARLDSTANEPIDDRVCLAESCSGTGKHPG